jgi:hypothetical protein
MEDGARLSLVNLEEALKQFDLVEANVAKVDAAWSKMKQLIPDGISFADAGPEGREYRQLRRDYESLLAGLPPIDGWRMNAAPPDNLDSIAQQRLDAAEIGDFEAKLHVEQYIFELDHDLDEYRARIITKRRELVRQRLDELIADVDTLLKTATRLAATHQPQESVRGAEWEAIEAAVVEIDRLLGSENRGTAWSDLRRHLKFALKVDLTDIVRKDWPAVRGLITRLSYNEAEPLPLAVEDLGTLVATRPKGKVTTALDWGALDEEGFERLIFSILDDASGYENPEWLMKTNAPDRGRDLSVWRVRDDALSGTSRDRVMVQCRHWLSKSIKDTDISDVLTRLSHWEPPSIDSVIFATSGRFTADAVRWIEQHNSAGKRPRIDMWPDSHIERLLAARPHIVATFGLR